MKTKHNNATPSSPTAFAVALATAQSGDCQKTCRRWRRQAALRRSLALALLFVATLALVGSVRASLAHGTWTTGALSTDETVTLVRQMLNKQ